MKKLICKFWKAKKNTDQFKLFKKGGIAIGMTENHRHIFYIKDDTHTLCIGATRSGKSRHVVLPSIGVQAFAGESMVNADPKGELYLYTSDFLESMGYEVVVIDFEEPLKSNRYNFLQPIIDFVNQNDVPKAVEATWDVVASLVGENKGEKIWHNGECSILACAIMCVVFDNKHNYEYQNLTNVYHFIGKMCTAIGEKLPLTEYLKTMPDSHPAKGLVDISNVAPSRTRGSFYTSALTTLKLFTNPLIYDMSCATDFDFYGTGIKKQAIFIILPDEKSTYYSVASLFVSQHYIAMVSSAKRTGGRLLNRINYNLDEIGNFTNISDFSKMLTVGGGRGMRFNLFLQDFNQLDEVYGKNMAAIIRNNCETWLYIQSDNEETQKELSGKLGLYTIKSQSFSHSSGGQSGYSASYNLTGRELLKTDEIKRIRRPYMLVTSRADPAIMYSPDISKTIFNELYGMGDEEFNRKLMMRRGQERPSRVISNDNIILWGVWNEYIKKAKTEPKEKDNQPSIGDAYSTSVKARGSGKNIEKKRN